MRQNTPTWHKNVCRPTRIDQKAGLVCWDFHEIPTTALVCNTRIGMKKTKILGSPKI